jgi:hypothetical protein
MELEGRTAGFESNLGLEATGILTIKCNLGVVKRANHFEKSTTFLSRL